MRRKLAACLLLALLAGLAPAQEKKLPVPTIDEAISLKSAQNPRISPDGRYVAYQGQETNWTDNAFESEIWIADTASGARY